MSQRFNPPRITLQPFPATYTSAQVNEGNMDMEKLLTKEKANLISEKIAKGLEDNKIVGSANMVAYAIKESWLAGFEDGRKYPL
jgi:hypothetical protein